jgi:sec-independent protein translocase protein TatB
MLSLLALLDSIGSGELFILAIIGVLLFGRDLPGVGRKLGQTLAQFRRGIQDFKDQMDRDADMKEMKNTIAELKKMVDVPRNIANPARLLRDLTNEALYSPPPPVGPVQDAIANGTSGLPPAAAETPPDGTQHPGAAPADGAGPGTDPVVAAEAPPVAPTHPDAGTGAEPTSSRSSAE